MPSQNHEVQRSVPHPQARKTMETTGLDEVADDADATPDCDGDEVGTDSEGTKVTSLHTRRLPPDPCTSLPDLSKYDRLLAPVTSTNAKRKKGTTA
ncbi:hypothetical protein [Streptomyces sp. NPDC058424]|uniref:hypothetical protein n=1 Tax=Streptomyces sp. NPDC058424 TaxID=3346491 RepID=UPI00364E6146